MRPLAHQMYELRFELEYMKRKGNAFQDFFADLMELRYDDFVRTKPWGSHGDRKNDGYLPSDRHLFQVYAPNEMTAKKAVKKIEEDFSGALPYWEEYFDKWSFVHNSRDGLSPDVVQKLLALDHEHEEIGVASFGFTKMRRLFWDLSDDDRVSLMGPPAEYPLHGRLGFDKIKLVVEHVAKKAPDPGQPIRIPPQDKIDINGFSENTRALLETGYRMVNRVEDFFAGYVSDPQLGDKVAQMLAEEYKQLGTEGLTPDQIFSELFYLVSGLNREREVASLALISFFFEQCDIFEDVAPSNGPGQ